MEKIPSYDDIKKIKSYETYDLYDTRFGGSWRLTINEVVNMSFEENKEITCHNIALDYLEDNFHIACPFKPYESSHYEVGQLYKLNKKNYTGLIDMYKRVLYDIKNDIDETLKELKW